MDRITACKDMIENIPVAMLVAGKDMLVASGNKQARSVFNLDEQHFPFIFTDIFKHVDAADAQDFYSGKEVSFALKVKDRQFLVMASRTSVPDPAENLFFITLQPAASFENDLASLLIGNTREPFMVLDRELIVRALNKAYDHISREFMKLDIKVGTSVLDYIPASDLERISARYQRVLDGATEISGYEIPYIDNTIKYFESVFAPMRDANNKIIGVFISSRDITDITEKKRADAQILQMLEEKNTILESIDDAFFAVDHNWIVTYWNNKAEKILSVRREEILGKDLWTVFKESVGSLSYNKYHEALLTNRAVNFEDHFEPMQKWYCIDAYPSANGLSVYFKDISERKFSEIKLRELNASLERHSRELAVSNKELEQFAYVASHDLQEPLRMVTSFVSQIEKKYGHLLDDKGKQYIEFAVDGAKRMRRIILDLLEFSRVGRTGEEPEIIDLKDLLGDVERLFRERLEETNAVISMDTLPLISSYRTPLKQVFQNLLSNALKYSRKDVQPRIHIHATAAEDHWHFSVSDNGIGIDKAYFEKIFIIFQRLHNKDEYSGTGMGLAVTKKIIENMGGSIWLESEEGKGSTFHFTIAKYFSVEKFSG